MVSVGFWTATTSGKKITRNFFQRRRVGGEAPDDNASDDDKNDDHDIDDAEKTPQKPCKATRK